MKFQEIKIPETVSSIGNWAFSSCVAIKEINWPDKVKNINDYMFDGCKQLRKVNFPKDLKSIGDSAFGECVSMEEESSADGKDDWELCICRLYKSAEYRITRSFESVKKQYV